MVAFFHHEWQEPAFILYTGLLFGLPLAVTSFNRWSRFCESMARRLLGVMVIMYFDDLHLTDKKEAQGTGQRSVNQLNELLGTPFAPDKKQALSSTGDFLGLEHDLSQAHSQGLVYFWARDRICQKLGDLIKSARHEGRLKPGTAAKIYGIASFFEQGFWGRVGRGGLESLKERQYDRAVDLTPPIQSAFDVLDAIMSIRPQRTLDVYPREAERFAAASDAALELPGQGTGGFHLVGINTPSLERFSYVAHIPPDVYHLWEPGDHKIAQLELLMVIYALFARPWRGVWWIDNTAALMALLKGTSNNPDLARMSQVIHLTLFAYRSWFYWEWIPSKSNWADAISRDGASDTWFRRRGFQLDVAFCPTPVWTLPFPALLRVAAFM